MDQNQTAKELIKKLEDNLSDYYRMLNALKSEYHSLASQTSEGQLDRKIKEYLINLIQMEDEVIEFRLKKIIQEEHPYLPEIIPEVVKNTRLKPDNSMDKIVDRFLKQRLELIKMLYAIPSESWDRTGVHATEGHIPFRELVRRLADKDPAIISDLRERIP